MRNKWWTTKDEHSDNAFVWTEGAAPFDVRTHEWLITTNRRSKSGFFYGTVLCRENGIPSVSDEPLLGETHWNWTHPQPQLAHSADMLPGLWWKPHWQKHWGKLLGSGSGTELAWGSVIGPSYPASHRQTQSLIALRCWPIYIASKTLEPR